MTVYQFLETKVVLDKKNKKELKGNHLAYIEA